MSLNARSRSALHGVHPDLVRVIQRAADYGVPFFVTEGLRTMERQRQLLAAGKSKTLQSRHLQGFAVDLVCAKEDGSISYADADMLALSDVVKRAATECGVPVEWGGDWKSFCDTPHFQLSAKHYPDAPSSDTDVDAPTVEIPAPKRMRDSTTAWSAVIVSATGATSAVKEVLTVTTDVATTGKQVASAGKTAATLAATAPPYLAYLTIGLSVVLIALGAYIYSERKRHMKEHGR